MLSSNKWRLVLTLVVAICAIAFFLRHEFSDSAETGRSNVSQKELKVDRKDQTRNNNSRAERERVAKHNEMLERLNNEAAVEAKKAFADAKLLPPPIISIGSGGDLNWSVIHALSLSASEVKSLKTILSETRSKEAKMFAERAERQPVNEDMDEGSVKYLIRAKRDRGVAEMKRLAEKVGQILDAPRSKQFMGGVGDFDFYGGFGKYDVEVTFYSENGVDMVKERYLNPSTGNPTRFGAGSLDDPNYSFWKEINLPKR